jgi:hypothetical protein
MRVGLIHSMNLSSIQMRSGWWQTEHLRLWALDALVSTMRKSGTAASEGGLGRQLGHQLDRSFARSLVVPPFGCCGKIRAVTGGRRKGSRCVKRREDYGDWRVLLRRNGLSDGLTLASWTFRWGRPVTQTRHHRRRTQATRNGGFARIRRRSRLHYFGA